MSTLSIHADLAQRLGGVALSRIRTQPAPGTATVADVIEIQEREGVVCELIEGVLVEKAMGYSESSIGGIMYALLLAYVRSRNLGIVIPADGTVQLMPGVVRAPDVAFTSWNRYPGRRYPTARIPAIAPTLAVEVLSHINTLGEMTLKRQDYFASGVELVWEVDPETRTIDVYTSTTNVRTLTVADTLDGGAVLPGFAVAVGDVFAELDRRG